MSGAASYSVENRLNEVIAAYIEAVDAGKQPNQQDILEQHPDLAAMLKEFFADHERMRRAAVPFQPRNCTEAATLPPSAPKSSDAALAKVRYFGDYELLEEISRGGMGVVYRARQVSLNRIVALKMILAGQFASEADVQRFRLEAEAAANLDHPNIVPIYEVGEHEGQHYFSMKLVEARTSQRACLERRRAGTHLLHRGRDQVLGPQRRTPQTDVEGRRHCLESGQNKLCQ